MLLLFRFWLTLLVVMVIWNTIPGFAINNMYEAFLFAIILSAVNSIVRPVLVFLTLPITILTLGLFTLVINVFTFWLAGEISYGVHIETFSAAFWGGLIMWITGFITNRYIWHVNIY
ncbi:MAG: phage holin family protein [Chlamydiae bacterium]|nr:phage holin family protein [Chlamydiota bacterium]